jgi:hypothetical protein
MDKRGDIGPHTPEEKRDGPTEKNAGSGAPRQDHVLSRLTKDTEAKMQARDEVGKAARKS